MSPTLSIRRWSLGVIVACVAAIGPSRSAIGDEVDPEDRAKEVRTAAAAAPTPATDAELTRLALATDVDPWLVLDRLDESGDLVAAAKYAAKREDPIERAALSAFIAGRTGAPPDGDARTAMGRAEEQLIAGDAQRALDELDRIAKPRSTLLAAMWEHLRGQALGALHRTLAAGDAYDAAAKAARGIGWTGLERPALTSAAACAASGGAAASARIRYEVLLGLQEGEKPSKSLWRTLATLGDLSATTGDYPSALSYYARARDVAERADLQKLIWATTTAMAEVQLATGALGKAYALLSQSETHLAELAPEGIERDAVRLGFGALYLKVGDYAQAIRWNEQVAAASAARGDLVKEGIALGNIGLAYQLQGDEEKADQQLRAALERFDASGDEHLRLQWIMCRADVLSERGNHAASLPWFEELLTKAAGAAVPQLEAFARAGRGSSLVSIGRTEEGTKELAAVRPEMDRLHLSGGALYVDGKLALAALAAKDFDRSIAIAQAVAGSASLAGVDVDLDGELVSEGRGDALRAGTTAAIRNGEVGVAQQLIEADRAQRLVEALGGRWSVLRCGAPEAFCVRESNAAGRVRDALARLREDATGTFTPERKRLGKALADANADLQAAVDACNLAARETALGRLLTPRRASIAELRARLVTNEAFVYFAVAPASAWSIVITAKTARCVELDASKLEPAVEDLRQPLSADDAKSAIAALQTEFVDKLDLPGDTRHVTVCPDARCAIIPYGAVFGSRPCSIVPSATAYEMLARTRSRRGSGAVAIGRPVYTRPAVVAAATPVAARLGMLELSDLPATETEVPLAARLKTDVQLVKGDATKSKVLAALAATAKSGRRGAVLHFGCHGLLDRTSALRSALALTPEGGEPGLLTAIDVLKLQTPFDLVVLSACESGAGSVRRGDGVPGLVRAFLQSGAGSVVASVYRVDDASTGKFMADFYKRLWAGAAPADALAAAQPSYRGARSDAVFPWVIYGVPTGE